MNKRQIARQRLTLVGNQDMPEDVKKNVKEVLGYDTERYKPETPDDLAEALSKLEIEVMRWQDVVRYKFEAVEQANRGKLEKIISARSPSSEWDQRSVEWRSDAIKDFRGYIPSEVLERSVALKLSCDGVKISILSLEDSPDKFLVATIKKGYGENHYYLECWEEPNFKE